jgi:ribosome recycling factor
MERPSSFSRSRLRNCRTDSEQKASMGKNLMISEDRVKTLQNKIGQLNKHIKELEDEIDRLEE